MHFSSKYLNLIISACVKPFPRTLFNLLTPRLNRIFVQMQLISNRGTALQKNQHQGFHSSCIATSVVSFVRAWSDLSFFVTFCGTFKLYLCLFVWFLRDYIFLTVSYLNFVWFLPPHPFWFLFRQHFYGRRDEISFDLVSTLL